MKTLLVLIDFSNAALHAAKYAQMLAREYYFNRIVLLNVYNIVIPATDLPVMEYENSAFFYNQGMEQLQALKEQLSQGMDDLITIQLRVEEGDVAGAASLVAAQENASMIVMGMRGKSNLEKVLTGSSTVAVAKESNYPLLVVPQDAPLARIEKIAFACDFRHADEISFNALDKALEYFPTSLYVLNIDKEHEKFSTDMPLQLERISHKLEKYNPEYAYVTDEDTVHGIMQFAASKEISLVITFPKKYGFFEGLFHRSITKKLIYHSHTPVLCLHA